MAVFTSKSSNVWDGEGQTTWNEVGHPQAGDGVTVQTGHTVTLDGVTACSTLTIETGATVTDVTNDQGITVSGITLLHGTLLCGTAAMNFGSALGDNYGLEIEPGAVFHGGSGTHTVWAFRIDDCTCTLSSGVTTITGYNDFGGNHYALVWIDDTWDANGGTLVFGHATQDQEIWCSEDVAHSVHNLTVNKGATILHFGETTSMALTVTGDLTITAGTFEVWDGDGVTPEYETLTVTGDTSVSGFLDCRSSTVNLNGDVTVEAGGMLRGTTTTLSFGGTTWTNNNVYTHNSGSVVFTGTNQDIVGTNIFFNFDKHVASAATLEIDNGSTQTVAGQLDLYGVSGERLTIQSDGDGQAFDLVLTGTKGTLEFLTVQDSDASGSDADVKPIAPTNSVNVSGNTDWFPTQTQPEMQTVIIS